MWHYPKPFQKNYRKIYPESKLYIPGYISQYNLISDKDYAFFLSIARIKLAIVLSVASIGRSSLGHEKKCIFTFFINGEK